MIKTFIARVLRVSALKDLEALKRDFVIVENEKNKALSHLRALKEELEDLKLKRKIEEEDLKHLVKIRIEQNEIEFQKKAAVIEKEADKRVEVIKSEYDQKLRDRLEVEIGRTKEMYGEVLKRLPNINVRLKGDV